MTYFRLLTVLLFLPLMLATSVQAQEYKRSFRDWSVMKHEGECFIGTAPIKQSGNYSSRSQPYVLVVKRNGTDEVNVSSGYAYKSGSEVALSIGNNTLKLFTQEDTAWAFSAADDALALKRMKAGSQMTVKGTSQKGTHSTDTYSLMGFTAAYNYMQSQCR